jgi:cytochrome c
MSIKFTLYKPPKENHSVSQQETISARNNLILGTVLINLVLLFIVVAFVVDKLGFNFGNDENAITQESTNLLIKPLGRVNIGSADAVVPAVAAKPAAEMTKTDKVLALINDKGYICMGCHQVDKKLTGPAYQDVAAKYQGDEKAADMLAAKVKAGGAGTWGDIPMPPNPTVTDDDLKVILDWILTLELPAPPVEETAKSVESMSSMDSMDDKKKLATDKPAEVPAEVPAEAAQSTDVMTTDDAMVLIADKSYACLGCHQVDAKMIGPGYKEVAAKYKGDAAATDMLIEKIKNGGVGTWGEMPMPPNATVSDEDAKALVSWILSLQ